MNEAMFTKGCNDEQAPSFKEERLGLWSVISIFMESERKAPSGSTGFARLWELSGVGPEGPQ